MTNNSEQPHRIKFLKKAKIRNTRGGSGGEEFVELVGIGDHDNRNSRVAKNTKLVRLLEQTVPSLRISNLTIRIVFDFLNLDLASRHFLMI